MSTTESQADRLERKLDELLDLAPIIESLGKLLVRRRTANEELGLDKNTLSKNEQINKFEEFGTRKTFIEIGHIVAVKQRKRTIKRSK